MLKTLRISVLLLALCGSAFAGDIPCPAGPQSSSMTAEGPTVEGEMPNESAADGLVGTVLAVFESLRALI